MNDQEATVNDLLIALSALRWPPDVFGVLRWPQGPPCGDPECPEHPRGILARRWP